MRNISKEELSAILNKHQLWLENNENGERANLRSADLRYADLSYTDLSYADLRYIESYIVGPYRSDRYRFDLVYIDKNKWMVRAGCRFMTITDYRKHTKTYDDKLKKAETLNILDFLNSRRNQFKKGK